MHSDDIQTTPLRAKKIGYPFLQPPLQADEIGRIGHFRVLSLLGEGGMGYVFKGEDLTLHRPVALKVMKPDATELNRKERFLREARTLSQMKHDNLVAVFHADEVSDTAYYAMELLGGESLRDRLVRDQFLDVDEILRIGCELCSGLGFIHQQGLIHRDIKPANIWLETKDEGGRMKDEEAITSDPSFNLHPSSFRTKILDLGLVRQVEDDVNLTQSGIVLGTLGFMSPEQARGDPLDARSDLFSLGCVLYRLCAGVAPFEGTTTMALLTALAVDSPRAVRDINPRIPQSLSRLVNQLLSKDPRDRPASADEVREQLERIGRRMQAGAGPASTGTRAPERRARKAKKPRDTDRIRVKRGLKVGVIVAGAAGVVVLGIAAGLGLLMLWPGLWRPAQPKVAPGADKGAIVHLSDLTPSLDSRPPFKPPPGPDGKSPGDPIRKGGKEYKQGIFMQPRPPGPPGWGNQSEVSMTFDLAKKYSSFSAEVSLCDGPRFAGSPCHFLVYGDGQLLWKSQPVSSQADTQKLDALSVKNVDTLRIAVTCDGNEKGVHAAWLEAFLTK